MKLIAFAVYDAKAGAYLRPFFEPTKGSAVRAVMDALDDKNHPFARHTGDFSLWEVGWYDDAPGGSVVDEHGHRVLHGEPAKQVFTLMEIRSMKENA